MNETELVSRLEAEFPDYDVSLGRNDDGNVNAVYLNDIKFKTRIPSQSEIDMINQIHDTNAEEDIVNAIIWDVQTRLHMFKEEKRDSV